MWSMAGGDDRKTLEMPAGNVVVYHAGVAEAVSRFGCLQIGEAQNR